MCASQLTVREVSNVKGVVSIILILNNLQTPNSTQRSIRQALGAFS
jgi:hypothetical protein